MSLLNVVKSFKVLPFDFPHLRPVENLKVCYHITDIRDHMGGISGCIDIVACMVIFYVEEERLHDSEVE